SERLEEKRREAQDLREELRHLRGDDEDVMRLPGPVPSWEDDESASYDPQGAGGAEPHGSVTAEHEEVELGPLDEPTAASEHSEEEEGGTGTTRAMRLDEVQWDDAEEPPRTRDDEE
ncbi:MAG: hypothetical protein QOD37_2444, partial [Gaiellales bacterium]|nr:hypothetical protein [Gaiellales bacterium]